MSISRWFCAKRFYTELQDTLWLQRQLNISGIQRCLMSCRLVSYITVDLHSFTFTEVNINIIFLRRQTLLHVCICPYYLLLERQKWGVSDRQTACAVIHCCLFSQYVLILLNWNPLGFAENLYSVVWESWLVCHCNILGGLLNCSFKP